MMIFVFCPWCIKVTTHHNLLFLTLLYFRFLYCASLWGDEKKEVDRELGEYVTQAVQHKVVDTYLSHVKEMPCESRKEQFLLLSHISNYHWFQWTSSTSPRKKKTHVLYQQHILHDVDATEENGKYLREYAPTSPRNRIMYYLCNLDSYQMEDIYPSVTHLLQLDSPPSSGDTHNFDGGNEFQAPPRKKRKHSTRLVTGNAKKICLDVGLDMASILNCANPQRTLYTRFKEELVTQGLMKWRSHDGPNDICVMTDINSTTGFLLPNSFVHVSCRTTMTGEIFLKCSCAIYNLIQRTAHQEAQLVPEEEGILDAELTCMHCRFFRDHLVDSYNTILEQNTGLTAPLAKIQESLPYMNDPVQLLGQVLPHATTKFSVKGYDSYAVVHFNFLQKNCYAKCTEGMCAAKLKNKKKIPKSMSLSDKGGLCSHLQTIYDNLDYVKSFFPEYFEQQEEQDDLVSEEVNYAEYQGSDDVLNLAGVQGDNNIDDANVGGGVKGNFNMDTGLWEYKSKSKHTPREMMDVELIVATEKRNDFVRARNMDQDTGLYSPFRLIPFTLDEDGNGKPCPCGEEFQPPLGFEIETGKAILYTRNGPIDCICYDVPCTSGQCRMTYLDAAQQEGIFFYSKQTCVGEEVGWDFVSKVMKSKTSFTAFCSEMTRIYQTNNIMAGPFMSTPTFVAWFFGWLAAFKIDFRKDQVDPWCKYNPKILACDGTHIGVSIKNMQLEKPVTRPDVDTVLKPRHKRYNRVLLEDRDAREHLRYLTKKRLGKKIDKKKLLTQQEEGTRSNALLMHVAEIGHDPLTKVMEKFVQETMDPEILHCLTRVLYMISGDSCLSSAVPFPCHEMLQYCCHNIADFNTDPRLQQALQDMRRYNVDISNLLKLSIQHDCTDVTVPFLDYLVLKIQDIHSDNRPAVPAQPIPGTYNPRSGTAYYFTPSGERLRDMPHYNISGNSKRKYYDDDPQVDEPCRKIYPEVSFGGFGYLFLWFCPIHGHCYGMHLIAGGEGRKDPFASLYKHIEKAPDHIFYDFACQLSEYCLNRDPEFFKNTRFWHDLFHSIGHVCGINFKSGRIEGLEGINTEICEQVNAFLQCVKYTASHLSQDHFMFFLQFFLYLMNKEKTSKFKKQATIAVAGQI